MCAVFAASMGFACGAPSVEDTTLPEDLPLGQVGDLKADQPWTYAKQCKTIPNRPQLVDPRIVISLDGLTLRLRDGASDFERVYPVGVGTINNQAGARTEAESLSLYPVLRTGRHDFSIETSAVNPCRIWWTDKATGKTMPVFAGLPFLSVYGPYGIHGPVTSYWRKDGGKLKRGYVSHGCIRMESADIAELWAYIKGKKTVPIRLQKEIERRAEGSAIDIASR